MTFQLSQLKTKPASPRTCFHNEPPRKLLKGLLRELRFLLRHSQEEVSHECATDSIFPKSYSGANIVFHQYFRHTNFIVQYGTIFEPYWYRFVWKARGNTNIQWLIIVCPKKIASLDIASPLHDVTKSQAENTISQPLYHRKFSGIASYGNLKTQKGLDL